MKTAIRFVLVAAILFAGFSACHKSSNPPPYFMTATINGSPFSVSNCVATLDSNTLGYVSVVINGANYTSGSGGSVLIAPYITLSISNLTGVGTYIMADTLIPPADTLYYTVTGQVDSANGLAHSISSRYGTITITQLSPNLVGTFSFTGTDSGKVTNGSFTAFVQQ